ncbi:MAG: FAD:protein FMN transferase [Verrucomicrobiae bacterium]|nr:FAD:protein FMN transferase [Verrucomicrobiae bacterium]
MSQSKLQRLELTHDAMSTTFTAAVFHSDPRYARQAVEEAFAELDRIEERLTRFADNSDIARINRLRAGESVLVHPDTYDCLRVALRMQRATGGVFDVAYASARQPKPGPRIALEPRRPAVRVLADGTRLDLGAIGKGFALDRMAALLKEWGVRSALLCASASSLLAMGPPPDEPGWRISFGLDGAKRIAWLANVSFSGSGLAVKGRHICDPRTGQPADGNHRAWAAAPTAAVSDALSTAFMILTEEEIRDCCRRLPKVSAFVQKSEALQLTVIADRIGSREPSDRKDSRATPKC